MEDISTGTLHTYHQDEQASTAYITGRDGAVENCYSYDAFGNVLENWENVRNRILYTGQQYDQETGQYYLRARYYNPVIGRFTQEDAYRGDGLNLYAYCENNPVMYYDPSGLNGECANEKEQPEILTIDRNGAKKNRKESLKGIKTALGMDRDEYSPAMFKEGGKGADVRLIPKSDNRGSGAMFGRALKGIDNGQKVRFVLVD